MTYEHGAHGEDSSRFSKLEGKSHVRKNKKTSEMMLDGEIVRASP
jgi:hypothetical protein